MTSVKAHLTVAAMALAFGALSAPANATVSTPFGSINAGGFGISTPFGGVSTPLFGVGNGGPGAGGYHTGFGVFNPINWGGPGFGVSFPGGGANFAGWGIPRGNFAYGSDFGVSTPWGGFSGPGFGVSTPFGGINVGGFSIGNNQWCGFIGPCLGLAPQQALNVSTPFGGFYGPGFGVSTPWGGMNMGGFGISTPWGGMQTPIFGLNGQPMAGGPQIVPVMVPYPVPMQGQMMGAPAQGGAQPTQCMINAVPALTKSVDDCEKAGGAAVPQRTSAVQEAKKE